MIAFPGSNTSIDLSEGGGGVGDIEVLLQIDLNNDQDAEAIQCKETALSQYYLWNFDKQLELTTIT